MPSKRAVVRSILALVALTGGGCAGHEEPTAAPTNVLLIVVDTLRADRLGCYGSPRPTSPVIDALASDGTQFARAYSVSSWTMPAVASLLTGLYPSAHGVTGFRRDFPDDVTTVAGLFKEAGYATAAIVSGDLIMANRNFDRDFDFFDDRAAGGAASVSTPEVTATAVETLRSFEGQPFFLFVHYFDPHYDYRRHPQYGLVSSEPGRLSGAEDIWALRAMLDDMTDEELEHLRHVYDEEIRFTDAGVGELLDELRALGVDDHTAVIITADHGEAFRDHDWLGHTTNLYEEVLRVPLIVRAPADRWRHSLVEEPVSTLSVVPTMLELAGVDLESHPLQAAPLAPSKGGEHDAVFAEVELRSKRKRTNKRSLTRGRFKLIHDILAKDYELYDLARDPGETENVVRTQPEIFVSLREELARVTRFAREQKAAVREAAEPTPDTMEALRSLGYVETPGNP